METFCIDDTQIQVIPDAETGQQAIRIQKTAFGAYLAQTLESERLTPDLESRQGDDFYVLDHTPELDERLCNLIDFLVSLRYSHPQLLQLRLFPTEALA